MVLEPDTDSRVVPSGPFLFVSQVRNGDQGEYLCAATNPAGEDRASARLIIFGVFVE